MDASGIQGLVRIEVRELAGRPCALLIGHTADGQVAVGIASGPSEANICLLNPDAQAKFVTEFRAAILRAAHPEQS